MSGTRVVPLCAAVLLTACGGGGGSAPPPSPVNRAPQLTLPNAEQTAVELHAFSYDVSQGGQTFADPDGDTLRYEIELGPDPPQGLRIEGTRVVGAPEEIGVAVVTVTVSDPQGQTGTNQFNIRVAANGKPQVVNAPADLLVNIGAAISVDASAGATSFSDPDGDALTYSVQLRGAPGVSANGVQLSGTLDRVGLVEVTVTARDAYGGSGDDVFLIAAPAAPPGSPTLPATSYTYESRTPDMPYVYRQPGVFFDSESAENPTTNAGATLGRVLFHDQRLSITNTIACASCHSQAHGFASAERFNVGALGVPLKRHAMALANTRYNVNGAWFSDMRVRSLRDVAHQAMGNPEEMAMSTQRLESKLRATAFYAPLFETAFGTPEITEARVLRALEQYLQSLVAYRTKFDRAYNSMDNNGIDPSLVLDAQEMRGLDIFRGAAGVACNLCHQLQSGANVWQANNGLDEVLTDTGTHDPALQRDGSQGVFRAGALRNIAVSAPYMHDGRFATLRAVIDHYDHDIKDTPDLDPLLRTFDRIPWRMNLSDADKDALEAFLRTLTDEEMLADPKFSDPFL
jgi:cytochrome c peroxidase